MSILTRLAYSARPGQTALLQRRATRFPAWVPAILIIVEIYVLFLLMFCGLTLTAHSQTCVPSGGVQCTANLNLWLPPHGYQNWDIPMNANSGVLDQFSTTVIKQAPTGSQTVTQPLGTNLNLQFPLIFGTPSALKFGAAANIFDTSLSRPSPGLLSVDSGTVANGSGILTAGGYRLNNAAPLNHLLVGNGTNYADSATIPAGSLTGLFYQTVQRASTSVAQRARLNFSSAFTASDNAGNSSTDMALAATGVAVGACAGPTSVTFGADGRATAVACTSTNPDQYWTWTTCTAPPTEQCQGDITMPAAFSDSNYVLVWGMDFSGCTTGGSDICSGYLTVTARTSTGFHYGMNAGEPGTHPSNATIMMHAHHL